MRVPSPATLAGFNMAARTLVGSLNAEGFPVPPGALLEVNGPGRMNETDRRREW